MQNTFEFLPAYATLFSDKTYYIVYGGRNSGKSTQVAAYFLAKLTQPEYFRGVIARYTQKSIKSSIYQDILDLIKTLGLSRWCQISGDSIIYNPKPYDPNHIPNMIITHAMRIGDSSMTAKGKGLSKVTHLLIDEATELPSEEEFIKLNDSFRVPGVERKIFIIFNPTYKSHWIHKRWFIDGQPNPIWFEDHEFVYTTYKDNHYADPKKIQEWERLKDQDIAAYNLHIMGYWRDFAEGRIFDNWSFVYNPDKEAEVVYGLDFGFSNDPAALIKVHKRNTKLWIKECLYETGMTNGDLIKHFEAIKLKKTDLIIADSAEPKSIEDIRRAGYNIKPCYKGPDSISSGINKLLGYQIHCDPTSKNMIDEYNNYCWKKDTDRPIDKYNHLMDALRYSQSLERKIMDRSMIKRIF